MASCHGLVVKADQEVVGLNPGTTYWMDVSDDLKEKFKIKVAKWSTPKKNI